MLDLTRIDCLGDALRDGCDTFKTNDALIEVNRRRESARYTYRELRAAAEQVGGNIQSAGFEPGDRAAMLMGNQSRWIIGAMGALWSGATLVPLDYKLTPPEQLALLAHCQPKVLFTEYPVWRALLKLDLAPLERTRVIVCGAPDRADVGPALRWEKLQDGAFQYQARKRDDVACIVYSSGTGGTAKGCMLTHENYLEQAQVLGQLYPMKEQDRYFSILPTNHAIDFMCGFCIPLMFGGAIVHQLTLRPEFLMPTMKEHGITHIALVPRILKSLKEKIQERIDERDEPVRRVIERLADFNEMLTRRAPNHALSSKLLKPLHDPFGGKLRLIFCGGAFVERDTAEYFNRLGLPVVIGYGLTEAGTVLTLNDLKPFRGDTVGSPVPGVELELRNKNDEGVGEVWVKSRTVMKGYLEEPELTDEAIVDGWLRTGDLGVLDPAGHLKLLGRAKNMIVTAGGKNIYPEDVEAAFGTLDGCEEFCVFAESYVWPSGKLTDEKLLLVVRFEGEQTADAQWLDRVRSANGKLTDFKRVSGVVAWEDEFPRTASQKVKRQVLAEQLGKARSRQDAVLGL